MHFNLLLVTSFAGLAQAGRCDRGNAYCASRLTGSWCREESNTCHGLPAVSCSCTHGPGVASAGAGAGSADSSFSGSYSGGRRAAAHPGSYRVIDPPAAARTTPAHPKHGHDGSFLWLDWPTMYRSEEWETYFKTVIKYMQSNCGGIRINRVIMRVNHPDFQEGRGLLWQVSERSVFYTHFLSKLPSSIEVHILPYFDEDSIEYWEHMYRLGSPLENAFKYASQWNELLTKTGTGVRIAGIVVDKEEGGRGKGDFDRDMPKLADIKRKYSARGGAPLRFGMAIAFSSAGSMDGISPYVDDYYLEMYDFYIEGSYPVSRIRADSSTNLNDPGEFLRVLDATVWSSHLERYNDPRVNFMWSVQNAKSRDCLYPLVEGRCGPIGYDRHTEMEFKTVDFGSWEVDKFVQFLSLIKATHPRAFANKNHGLYQFSFMPHSWMDRCKM